MFDKKLIGKSAAMVAFVGLATSGTVSADFGVGAKNLLKYDCLDATDTAVACGSGDGIGEVALPKFINDPVNDKFTFRFALRNSGGSVVHYTGAKTTSYPASPCTSAEPDTIYKEDEEVLFKGNPTRYRAHALIELITSCWETGYTEYKEAVKTVFYSANVIENSGAKMLAWDGEEPVDVTFVDQYGGAGGDTLGTPDGFNEVTIWTTDDNGKLIARTYGFKPSFPNWLDREDFTAVKDVTDNPTNPSP